MTNADRPLAQHPHLSSHAPSLSLWQTDLDTSFFFTLWLECVYHAGLAEAGLLSSCTSSSVQEYCTWHSAWGCFSQKATHVHYYLWLWYICQLQMKDETMNIRHIHCRTQTKTSKCPFTSCSIHWYHTSRVRDCGEKVVDISAPIDKCDKKSVSD